MKNAVKANLKYYNGNEFVTFDGKNTVRTSDELIDALRESVKTGEIKHGKKYDGPSYTDYIFTVSTFSYKDKKTYKNKIIIRVDNKDKEYLKNTMQRIEDQCIIAQKVSHINTGKIVALILTGSILVTGSTFLFAKGLKYAVNKEYESKVKIQENIKQDKPLELTEEEEAVAIAQYYINLSERAKNGDIEAQKEYNQYLIEQELKEQAQQSENKFHR